jgi:hypothetical protein
VLLNQLFSPKKLFEGGNLELPNPEDPNTPYQADEIDLKVHNRTFMVELLDKLLNDINIVFYKQYKKPLWNPELLQSKQFLGGSSLHFFNTKGISDKEFAKHKPKVGDIDTQCNKELEPEIEEFLTTYNHKQVGDTTLLGFSRGSEQLNALFQFQDPPIKIQIDFEFGKYDTETDSPDEWYRFSHSSEWNDIQAGVKGVFHKWLYRALTSAHSSVKHQVDVKKTKTNIKPNVKDTDLSFAVASGQGGGLSQKYEPYIHTDPETGEKITHKDEVPYKRLVPSAERTYIQKLDQQFYHFFGAKPQGNDSELQKSFLGTLELINKYIPDQAAKEQVFTAFLNLCFDPGVGQMITKNDPSRDQEIKFAAIDNFIEICKLKNLRKTAVDMGKAYVDEFNEVQAYKKAHPEEKQPRAALKKLKAAGQPINEDAMIGKIEQTGKIVRILKKQHSVPFSDEKNWLLIDTDPAKGNKGVGIKWIPASTRFEWVRPYKDTLAEAEVKAQLRKGMPHLHDLKSSDLLDLLDEIHDGNGNFKLENIPLNVKVDGFGGRFGKNAEGKPFMGTSRTEPRYQAGFVKHHQEKGTTDPEILGRAQLFDNLFEEMMKAVKLVDSKLGPDFLVDKQVTCEVLYLPFATETDEGKLRFVGIHYDKLPEGVQLALVPFRVTNATTGEDLPDANEVVKSLTEVGRASSVMFIDNSLTQNQALDVTALVPPLENIEQMKAMLASKKRDQAAEVKAALQPVALALEKAIIEDPNIIGKDMLGQDYEGIVINSRLGPIKVTSQEQRDVISAKNAAKASARTERPRGESKTAVVAIGSFIGHKGHEELFNYTINKAKEVGGDPYLFIGNAEGKDDPIPPAVKIQTWHKLYPQYAANISTVSHDGGTLIQKIKHELINPLPGKPPRYDNIIIMVGEDRAGMNMPNALMKAVNKFQGYEHVKVSLGVTPRGTGISGTSLRNSLKNDPPEKALAVWSNAFDVKKLGEDWIKHLMDITRKGMGIQQQPQQPAPVAERLFNALMMPKQIVLELDTSRKKSWADYGMPDDEDKKPKEKVYHGWDEYNKDKEEKEHKEKEVDESTSIDSSLKIIINDISEPVASVYDKLKFMAKRYVHDHGELNRGWKMVEVGQGARWVQGMYNAQLKGALHALSKYNPKRTGELQQFLGGREVNGEIELKRSFNNIASELPEILAKIGNYIESPELTKAARRWMQNKTEYENYIDSLGDDEDDYDAPTVKPEKSKLPGQQNAQADQIVNDILRNLPSKVAGDIRNVIARSPNKLQALQAELKKRGVSVPTNEDWNKVNHHDKTDGLSQKAVNAYRRENPGSKLKTAVTTKPSKLKAGSKDAKRRKSFCARMSGNKGPMKDEKGRPTPKAKALRRWNCESIEEMQQLIMLAEQEIYNLKQGVAEDDTHQIKGNELIEYLMKRFDMTREQAIELLKKKGLAETEKQRLDPHCWKGYRKAGTKMKGGTRVNNCVPVREDVEDLMAGYIKLLENKR